MPIRDLINSYIAKGYSFRDAQNLAGEEIIIKKIASSEVAEHVTLKGGIVMYNISRSSRRVTQDIDFDLSDMLPPLIEVGASCSMTLMSQA